MDTEPVLLGRRTRLRPWVPADLDPVYAACQDPAIQRWTTVPSPYRREDASRYLDEVVPQCRSAGGAPFAVTAVDDPTGAPIANMALLHRHDGVGKIGYWVAARARGRGIGRDALVTLTDWCLTEQRLARVELLIEPGNTASRALAASAGFTAEGLLHRRRRDRATGRAQRREFVMYARRPD